MTESKIYKVNLGDAYAQVDLNRKDDWELVKDLVERAFRWSERQKENPT